MRTSFRILPAVVVSCLALSALACASEPKVDVRVADSTPADSTRRTPPAPAPAPAPVPAPAPTTPTDELVVLETTAGEIVIDLYEDRAPGHAENMKKLVRQGYYDKSPFHRVIEGFMAQGGGQWEVGGQIGGAPYTIPAEITATPHVRGSVSAARTGDHVNPNRESSGSQFYICFAPAPSLDNQYTVFGEVFSGMENVDKIVRGDAARNGAVDPSQATVITRAYLKAK